MTTEADRPTGGNAMEKNTILMIAGIATALIATGAVLLWTETPSKKAPDVRKATKEPSESAKALSASFSKSGTKLFEILREKGKNITISPYSIGMIMNMAYCGADGETAAETARALSLPEGATAETIMRDTPQIIDSVKTGKSVTIETANSIWTRTKVNGKYVSDCRKNFDAEVSDRLSKEAVNRWVAKKTHDKIKEIIASDDGLEVVLLNAVYFHGIWKKPFLKTETRKADFTKSDGSKIKADMMFKKDDLPYYEDDELQAIRIPYEGGVSMYVLLPKNGCEAKPVPEAAMELQQKMSIEEVEVFLPKFKTEYSANLKDALMSMGMKKAFSNDAEFKRISPGLKISSVIHKTFVDVNETGTEAAAATAVCMEATCVAPGFEKKPKEFIADRPFMYVIADDSTGIPLFASAVENPQGN